MMLHRASIPRSLSGYFDLACIYARARRTAILGLRLIHYGAVRLALALRESGPTSDAARQTAGWLWLCARLIVPTCLDILFRQVTACVLFLIAGRGAGTWSGWVYASASRFSGRFF